MADENIRFQMQHMVGLIDRKNGERVGVFLGMFVKIICRLVVSLAALKYLAS